jgi:hypothetical protein
MDGSQRVIGEGSELEDKLIEICGAIHNYSFDIFAHRVTKRECELQDIREYIEQDRTHFAPQDHSMLVEFLQHVEGIFEAVAEAKATKQLSTIGIKMLIYMYSYWTGHNLLPEDEPAYDKVTLLDDADAWLADSA